MLRQKLIINIWLLHLVGFLSLHKYYDIFILLYAVISRRQNSHEDCWIFFLCMYLSRLYCACQRRHNRLKTVLVVPLDEPHPYSTQTRKCDSSPLVLKSLQRENMEKKNWEYVSHMTIFWWPRRNYESNKKVEFAETCRIIGNFYSECGCILWFFYHWITKEQYATKLNKPSLYFTNAIFS